MIVFVPAICTYVVTIRTNYDKIASNSVPSAYGCPLCGPVATNFNARVPAMCTPTRLPGGESFPCLDWLNVRWRERCSSILNLS